VIFCVPVDYGTSSSSFSIIPGGRTIYRQSHKGDGGSYGAAECCDDAAAWGIHAVTSSIAWAATGSDAADGGCKGSCWGCSSTAHGGPPPVGGEQGGCPCVWSWTTTYSQGVEPGGLSETPPDEVWREDQSWRRRPMAEGPKAHLWRQDVPCGEQVGVLSLYAHGGGGALVEQHQIHLRGEGWASIVGDFQGEIPIRVLSRQHPVRQGGGVPLVDPGREDYYRVCWKVQTPQSFLHPATRWGVAMQEVRERAPRWHPLDGGSFVHQGLCRSGREGQGDGEDEARGGRPAPTAATATSEDRRTI